MEFLKGGAMPGPSEIDPDVVDPRRRRRLR
jgi:hypothetical protein